MVSLVGREPVYSVGGLGSIPSRTNTQGLKITEKRVRTSERICEYIIENPRCSRSWPISDSMSVNYFIN